MAEFGRTQVDYEGSPVQPVAPVQDNSDAAVVKGVSSLVDTVGQLFSGAAANKLNNVKINAKAEFEGQLAKIATAYKQGAYKTLDQAQDAWGQVYSKAVAANPALLPEYSESATRLAGAMGIGKVLEQGTREDQLYAKKEDEANSAGYIKTWMTPDQRKSAVNSYIDRQNLEEKMKNDERSLELESKRVGLDKSKLELLNARTKLNSINNLSTLADNYNPKFQSDMRDVIEQFKRDGDQKAAYLAIQQHWSVVDSTLRMVGKDAGGDYVNNLAKPMADIKTLAEDLVTGKIDQGVFERQVQVSTNLQQQMLLQDPEAVQLLAASKLFPNAELLLQSKINTAVMRYMDGSKPINLFGDTEREKADSETLMGLFKDNMRKVADGTATDLAGTKDETTKQVVRMVKGVSAFKDFVEKPEEYNKVVNFFASPEFGSYVTGVGGIPREVSYEAKNVLTQSYESVVLKTIKNEYDKAVTGISSTPIDVGGMGTYNKIDASGNKAVVSVIEPVYGGGGVVFRAKEGVELDSAGQKKLKELNGGAAKLLNKLVMMSAHLDGNTNYKKVFEDNYVALFGVEKPSEKK